jgi:diguanylate cyclase (GGDEF)-like protein
MLDLDHFKYINDNYGHSVGDLVLQEITQRWKKQIHSSDMLARIGGEEFCIVLPQAGLQQAKTIAEKIRLATSQAAIHVHNHQTHDLNLNISVSIGLVSSENRTQYDATMLMEFADKALYQAKVLGVIKSLRVPKRH